MLRMSVETIESDSNIRSISNSKSHHSSLDTGNAASQVEKPEYCYKITVRILIYDKFISLDIKRESVMLSCEKPAIFYLFTT